MVATNTNTRPKNRVNPIRSEDQEINYKQKFTEMLVELSTLYKRFPKYLLEIKAEDYQIHPIELKSLIRSARKSGELIKNEDDDTYYRQDGNRF